MLSMLKRKNHVRSPVPVSVPNKIKKKMAKPKCGKEKEG
jgi:hypothetical protein